MENGLNEKLTRIDEAVATIKSNLHFEPNAVIEDVAAFTDIKRAANVFVQDEEPVIKEGIWLQVNAEQHPFTDIVIDNQPVIPYKWQIATRKFLPYGNNSTMMYNNAPHFCSRGYQRVGNYLFQIGRHHYLMAYDLNDLSKMPVSLGGSGYGINDYPCAGSLVYTGEYLYSFGKPSYASKYDPIARKALNTSIRLGNGYIGAAFCPGDKKIYGFSGSYTYALDTTTDTETSFMNTRGNDIQYVLAWGDYIVWIYSNKSPRIEDALHNYSLVDVPASLANLRITTDALTYSHAEVDGVVYLGNKDHMYMIDKNTFECTDVSDTFYDDSLDNLFGMYSYNGQLYGITGSDVWDKYLTDIEFTGKDYDNNSLLIIQSRLRHSMLETQLWNNICKGRFLYSFYDVYYYNTETGINKEIPTYYGDGEKWIKFKN